MTDKTGAVDPKKEKIAKLEALRAATKREGDHCVYEVTKSFYRLGKMYNPGELVRLPFKELPSITFNAVEDVVAAPKLRSKKVFDEQKE